MAQFPVTKTADHDQQVGNLLAVQDGSSNYVFPTYLVTSSAVEIGTAASPLYVSPGTGASWAVTGPLTDSQLRATAVPVSLASSPLPMDAATATKQDSQTTHLATLAGAVSGTEVQVDVVTMPTVTIQDGGGSITVDGTVAVSGSVVVTNAGTFAVQAAQSGAWNVTNISGTISLPTGAATAAKQPALGTAGTASADVITVQGIASMTALKVDGSAVTQPVSGTFWQATQPVSIAAAVPVTDNSGSLTVDAPVGTPVFVRLSDGASAISTLPVSLASVPSHAVTNAGTFAVQAAQSGTWTVTGAGGTFPITDSGGSLTVDNSGTFAVQAAQSGTWNVGTVTTLPARAATTDTITAKLATDAIQNGTTALTPKYAKISASSSGNNTVVAAVTSKKIRVLGWNLVGNGAVNAKWQDGASGTDLTGLYYVAAAGGGISVPFNPVGWFETSSNTLLNLNLSGAVAVGGSLCYVEV